MINRSVLMLRGRVVASICAVIMPTVVQLSYGYFYCRYSLVASFAFGVFLSLPPIVCLLMGRYFACITAAGGITCWVVWENHIQCASENGPFVGGLGPIYLLTFGWATAIVLGILVAWFERNQVETLGSVDEDELKQEDHTPN